MWNKFLRNPLHIVKADEARDDLVNAFSDVELVGAIEEMSLDDAADLLEDMPAGVVKRVLEKSSKQTRESLNKLLNYPLSLIHI